MSRKRKFKHCLTQLKKVIDAMAELLEMDLSFTPVDAVKRIALVVLTTDHTSEVEFARSLTPLGIEVFTARVAFANPTTPENLRAMTPHIKSAAASILPGSDLDVIYYACTSGAVHIGNDTIIQSIQEAKPGSNVITPATAAVAALQALEIKSLALLTPYTRQASLALEPYFENQAQLRVVRHSYLGIADDREMARLDADTLIRAAINADHPEAETLFISCTALRAVEIAGAIEQKIGKPVITSNQAAIWHSLQLIGREGPNAPESILFQKH